MSFTDSEIIQKVKEGETVFFRELVERYKDRSFSLIMKILKHPVESEDCLQEVFLKVFSALRDEKFQEKAKFSTYLYTIVYNCSVDHYRKLKNKSFNIVSIEVNETEYNTGDELVYKFKESEIISKYNNDKENNPEISFNVNEVINLINAYIDNIPEHYSVILNMFYLNSLSHQEISQILKIPLGTVKNRIFRAKEKLKEILLEKIPEKELLEYV
jgi:RNA polymerase sigma-70 factor, ECF subfamily